MIRAAADRTADTHAVVGHVTITSSVREGVCATDVVPTKHAGTRSRGNAEGVSTR